MAPESTHEETARAWEIVARAKYEAEMGQHLQLLGSGGHTLLPPELDVLGPHLSGAHIVHLQCSHGLDALGLLNLGAASVTGIDISPTMIRQAQEKAAALGAAASFLCSDVSSVSSDLDGSADLVYTGKGALPRLMDLAPWAKLVARLLRPGGRIFIFEGHPLDWLWQRDLDSLQLCEGVGYFDLEPRENPGFPADLVEQVMGPHRPRLLERQWRPDQVITCLMSVGLRLELFQEHPLLFWDQFPQWPEQLLSRLPHSYSLMAVRDEHPRSLQPYRIR